jgi:hypothetical protein
MPCSRYRDDSDLHNAGRARLESGSTLSLRNDHRGRSCLSCFGPRISTRLTDDSRALVGADESLSGFRVSESQHELVHRGKQLAHLAKVGPKGKGDRSAARNGCLGRTDDPLVIGNLLIERGLLRSRQRIRGEFCPVGRPCVTACPPVGGCPRRDASIGTTLPRRGRKLPESMLPPVVVVPRMPPEFAQQLSQALTYRLCP